MKKQKMLTAVVFMLLMWLTTLAYANPLNVEFISIDKYKISCTHVILVDVRSTNSRAKSNLEVPNSVWINPYSAEELKNFVTSSDKNKHYTVFCSCIDDNYSIRTTQILIKNGFKHVNVLRGGWNEIKKSGIELVRIEKGNEN